MPLGSSFVRAGWGGAVFAPFGGAAFAAFAGRGRDIGFSGEYCVAVGLTILIASDPRKRLAVIKHAFAIQVVIAGDALKFGDGCRGRGVAHNTVQRAIRRTYEYVGKSPGKRDDDLHGRSHDRHCSPMATRRDLGFPLDCCASSFLLDVGRKDLHKCSPGLCKLHGYANCTAMPIARLCKGRRQHARHHVGGRAMQIAMRLGIQWRDVRVHLHDRRARCQRALRQFRGGVDQGRCADAEE